MENQVTKICKECLLEKPLADYRCRHSTDKTYYEHVCKKCQVVKAKERRNSNLPAARAAERQRNSRWAAENRDRKREHRAAYRERNKAKIKEASRLRYQAKKGEYKERHRKYYEENYSRVKDAELQRKYGITLEDYEAMHLAQGGVCAICGKPETSVFRGTPRSLSVDHHHKTGQVRELLCFRCNSVLGKLEESPELIKKLLAYAERWESL